MASSSISRQRFRAPLIAGATAVACLRAVA
jgi:hypothetical protein